MPTDIDDADIVLEEVSKIFRCKDCLRCFISVIKFAEHFPVYHPAKINAAEEDQRSQEKDLSAVAPIHTDHDECDGVEISEEPLTNDNTKVPRSLNISLKRKKSINSRGTVALSNSPSAKKTCPHDETAQLHIHHDLHDEPSTQKDTNTTVISLSNKESKNETTNQAGHLINSNFKDVSDPTEEVGAETKNKSKGSETESKECSVPKDVEVITLSDSDDDSYQNTVQSIYLSPTHAESCMSVKQEVNLDQETNEVASPEEGSVLSDNVHAQNESRISEDDGRISLPFQKKYFCQYCKKLFSRDRTLQSHVKAIHPKEYERDQLHEDNGHCHRENGNESKQQKERSTPVTINESDTEIPKSRRGKRGVQKSSVRSKKTKRKHNNSPVNEETSTPEEKEENNQMLTFSCKWCPEKFRLLESLKRHAINVHIKYKTM